MAKDNEELLEGDVVDDDEDEQEWADSPGLAEYSVQKMTEEPGGVTFVRQPNGKLIPHRI